MLADNIACNPRNPYPTSVFNDADQQTNLYDDIVEVDYRGYEVYITGHGGDGFMKFQDKEEVTSDEIGAAFALMHKEAKYHEMLFISDTCQAASLYGSIQAPHILSMASSKIGEDSLSHHVDYDVGVSIIDRFTYYLLEFLQEVGPGSKATMQDLITHIRPTPLHSTFNYKATLPRRPLTKTLVLDFFGAQKRVASRRHQTPPKPQCPKRQRTSNLKFGNVAVESSS
ncbi:glycosylphosphatidylinositol anchor biosynthesis [Trebouxia sp. C0009 RCD-2024]